jgi:hypothetical protein
MSEKRPIGDEGTMINFRSSIFRMECFRTQICRILQKRKNVECVIVDLISCRTETLSIL